MDKMELCHIYEEHSQDVNTKCISEGNPFQIPQRHQTYMRDLKGVSPLGLCGCPLYILKFIKNDWISIQ
jgi:hypothetical protein